MAGSTTDSHDGYPRSPFCFVSRFCTCIHPHMPPLCVSRHATSILVDCSKALMLLLDLQRRPGPNNVQFSHSNLLQSPKLVDTGHLASCGLIRDPSLKRIHLAIEILSLLSPFDCPLVTAGNKGAQCMIFRKVSFLCSSGGNLFTSLSGVTLSCCSAENLCSY